MKLFILYLNIFQSKIARISLKNEIMENSDSIELVEENLNPSRTLTVCDKILSISDTCWCISLRKCTIADK